MGYRRTPRGGECAVAVCRPVDVALPHSQKERAECSATLSSRLSAEAAGAAATLLDGKLIEKPVIRAAMRTLEHVGGA